MEPGEGSAVSVLDMLRQVKRAGVRLSLNGTQLEWDAPAGVMTPQARELLAEHEQEIVEHLHVDKIMRLIYGARDWANLELALEAINEAARDGTLKAASAEPLVTLTGQRSRRLPEKADESDEYVIWADDLLATLASTENCYACGQARWVDGKCAVCHPPPRSRSERG